MGAGKSTIGKVLAQNLEYDFFDTDIHIERSSGKSIAELFSVSEDYFRSWESSICRSLKNKKNTIISTGGGIVLDFQNHEWLKNAGLVVYLHTSVNALLNRLKHDTKRPLLQGTDKQIALQALYDQRHPIYENLADIVLDTTEETIDTSVAKLTELYSRRSQL
jgi:shikimate kinase